GVFEPRRQVDQDLVLVRHALSLFVKPGQLEPSRLDSVRQQQSGHSLPSVSGSGAPIPGSSPGRACPARAWTTGSPAARQARNPPTTSVASAKPSSRRTAAAKLEE